MNDQPEIIFENVEKKLNAYCNQILEHTDAETIQIFITKTLDDHGNTAHAQYGKGNFFARKGQIQSWLDNEKAISAERAADATLAWEFDDDDDLTEWDDEE